MKKYDINTRADERVNTEAPNKKREKARERMKSLLYMLQGLQFWKNPMLKTLAYLTTWMIAAFIIIGAARIVTEDIILPLLQPLTSGIENFIYNLSEERVQITRYIVNFAVGFVGVIIILLLFPIFRSLGKPKKADKIDDKAATAFGLKESFSGWFTRPFLISIVLNKNIVDYVFWSEWLDIDEWEDVNFLNAFCHSMSLDRQSVVIIRGGRSGKRITVRAIPLDKADSGGVAHDPLFKN